MCAFKLPLGDAGPPEVGVVSEPDGAVAADVKSLRQGVSHVTHPVFAKGLTKKPDGDWMIITLFRTETSSAPSTMRKPSVRPCGIDSGGSKVCERPGTGNLPRYETFETQRVDRFRRLPRLPQRDWQLLNAYSVVNCKGTAYKHFAAASWSRLW